MASPSTRRSPIIAASAGILLAACAFFLFAGYMSHVQAAKRAVLAEDAGVLRQIAEDPVPRPAAVPVLVELFTSEGCSSCPPADALLARLRQTQPVPNANIIVLEEHVDYWESLGWHDRFSSALFTERQRGYQSAFRLDDIYTPQMIVDGADQFVGNDSAAALRSIARSAHQPKAELLLSPLSVAAALVTGSVALKSPPPQKANLYAALVETMASTRVEHGENGGRTLNHVSILRALQPLGSPAGAASSVGFSLSAPSDVQLDNLRVVVFLQKPNQGAVLGAATSGPLAPSPHPATAVAVIQPPVK